MTYLGFGLRKHGPYPKKGGTPRAQSHVDVWDQILRTVADTVQKVAVEGQLNLSRWRDGYSING